MKLLLKIGASLAILFGATPFIHAQITTFDFTGDVQTYTVPVGVTSIEIEAFGAQGGGTFGGEGGRAVATLPVTPGDVLEVYVGGQPLVQLGPGGYNGGGAVNALPCGGGPDGWPGGGASDVRTSPSLDDRMIVAGGGGGQGYSNGAGGDGGGLEGDDGFESWIDNTNGKGGTQVAGGAGGDYGPYDGPAAGSGTFGLGGISGPEDTYCTGGGGGGGWYGGGGGFVSAGAGGSSYIDYPGTTDELTESGIRTGHGQIIITVLCSPLTVTVSDEMICLGESLTLDAEGVGEIEWDGGVVNGEPFTPDEAGVFTYTATSDADGDCGYEIEIEVLEAPEVVAVSSDEEVCEGDFITLSATGADSYEWFPLDVEPDVPFSPEVGEHTYTVVGTNLETECESAVEIVVTVHATPEIEASANDEEICLGDTLILYALGPGGDYTWEPEATHAVPFVPTETGTTTYNLSIIDGNNCTNETSIDITVYDALALSYTTIDEVSGDDGAIDITVTGGDPAYSYDWDTDEADDFDDSEDLIGVSGGTYNVVVMCEAGCTIMETINVTSQIGIREYNALDVSVYPNPTAEQISIVFDGPFDYELTGMKGDLIFNGTGFNSEELNVSSLSKGSYLITIRSQGHSTTLQLIKE